MSTEPFVEVTGYGQQVPVTFCDPDAGVRTVICTRRRGTEQEADMWYVIEVEHECTAKLERVGDGWEVEVVALATRYGQTDTQVVRYASADGGRTWRPK